MSTQNQSAPAWAERDLAANAYHEAVAAERECWEPNPIDLDVIAAALEGSE
jgi:hypothetical protein